MTCQVGGYYATENEKLCILRATSSKQLTYRHESAACNGDHAPANRAAGTKAGPSATRALAAAAGFGACASSGCASCEAWTALVGAPLAAAAEAAWLRIWPMPGLADLDRSAMVGGAMIHDHQVNTMELKYKAIYVSN